MFFFSNHSLGNPNSIPKAKPAFLTYYLRNDTKHKLTFGDKSIIKYKHCHEIPVIKGYLLAPLDFSAVPEVADQARTSDNRDVQAGEGNGQLFMSETACNSTACSALKN